MHLDGNVPAQAHARQLLVGKVFDHLEKARVGAEQVLAEVSSALDKIFLILPVADFSQTPHQQAVPVTANQAVPIRAPDDLDDVPSRAAENRFKFLNDLAIAAHRAVEALKVAVDYEDEVVEIFSRGQRD